jgi:hypothetical protein
LVHAQSLTGAQCGKAEGPCASLLWLPAGNAVLFLADGNGDFTKVRTMRNSHLHLLKHAQQQQEQQQQQQQRPVPSKASPASG